jgi:tetratricopeptide (TPR) repeat protein
MQAAARHVEEALACAAQVTDEEALARIYTNVALFYAETGDLARASRMIEKAAEMSRLVYRPGEAINLSNLGFNYIHLGMADKSLPVLRRAIDLAESIGARRFVGYARLNLALAHFRLGELPTARQILGETLPELEAVKDTFAQASTFTYLALALEAGGEAGAASEPFHRALEILNSIGAFGYARDAIAGLARCALALGRIEEALQHAGQIWNSLQQNGSHGMEFPIWAYLTCARVFQAAGDSSAVRAALEAGYQELYARAGKISDPDWRQSFLENIPEHREIARLVEAGG